MDEKASFETWAIVELFGHQVIAGRVSEQVIASQGFVRVDVPAVEKRDPYNGEATSQPGYTRLFGPGAIYAITPTTEEIVTGFVARNVGVPIQPYQLTLPARASEEEEEE